MSRDRGDVGQKMKDFGDRFEKLFADSPVSQFAQLGVKQLRGQLEGVVKETLSSLLKERPVLQLKKLDHFSGELPQYESEGASGLDLAAMNEEKIELKPGERTLVPTGLAFEIPLGFEMQIRPRSGLAIKKGISMVNTPGTIDADYRGEVKVIVINHGHEIFEISKGDRIAQAVIAPVVQAKLAEVQELGDTDRGTGGFGSTGV